MKKMPEFNEFINNKDLWIGDVETKTHPKKGVFAEGTAEEISEWCTKSHKTLKSAITSINFYINRAGDKLSKERINTLEKAKTMIEKHFKEKTIKESDEQEFWFTIDEFIGKIEKVDGKWREYVEDGEAPDNYGSKTYMSYLSPEEVISWLKQDYGRKIDGPFMENPAYEE